VLVHDPGILDDVHALMDRLRVEGADSWATRLDIAEGGGATSTEILMTLRYELTGILRDRRGVTRESRKHARSLRWRIRRVLGSR